LKANEVRSTHHIFLPPLVWAKTAEASGFRNGSDQGARELSAFEKQMATALTECPWGTSKRKQIVAGQMLPAVEVGSYSYEKGAFQQLWLELN
jgi:hypothetical protein